MSDQPAAESVSSSPAPQPSSTAAIAASVISDAEQADTSSAESGYVETPRVETTQTTVESPPAAPTPAELSAAAKFLLKQGHKLKKDDGRDVWLPAKTVEGMLDRYVGEYRTTWDGERATLAEQAKQAEQLRSALEELRASVGGDPRAFLQELAGIDPRYQAFLPAAASAGPDMPAPDLTLPDGSQTYSLKGLQALLEWNTARVEAKMDERLKPITDREQQARIADGLATKTRQQIEEAKTWPGFAEHEPEILKALQADTAAARAEHRAPRLSLEGAYRQVVIARLTEDNGKTRERLLKELQAAPTGTALPRQTADAPRTAGPRSTTEIARSVISKLESGGA